MGSGLEFFARLAIPILLLLHLLHTLHTNHNPPSMHLPLNLTAILDSLHHARLRHFALDRNALDQPRGSPRVIISIIVAVVPATTTANATRRRSIQPSLQRLTHRRRDPEEKRIPLEINPQDFGAGGSVDAGQGGLVAKEVVGCWSLGVSVEGSEGFLGGKSSSTSSSCLREARWYWCWGVEGRDGGDVDGVGDDAAGERRGHLLGGDDAGPVLCLGGRGAQVGREDDIGPSEDRMLRERLAGKDVERRPGEVPALEAGLYRVEVDQLAAGAVDEPRPLLHGGDGLGVGAHIAEDWRVVLGVNDRVALADVRTLLQRRILEAHMLSGVTVIDPGTNTLAVPNDSIALTGPGNAGFATVATDGLLYVMNTGDYSSGEGRLSVVDPLARTELARP